MNKRDVMKADGSCHSLFDLPCPCKVLEWKWKIKHLYQCGVTWVAFMGKIVFKQTGAVSGSGMWTAESHINCLLLGSSRPLPSLLTLSRHTHTDRDADLIVYHTCDLLGWGLWELGQTRVAGKGQQTVSSSGPWWEMFGVGEGCRLISLACFLRVNLRYIFIKKI